MRQPTRADWRLKQPPAYRKLTSDRAAFGEVRLAVETFAVLPRPLARKSAAIANLAVGQGRKWILSQYDDYELSPEQQLDLLRFQIGGMSIDEVLASGPDWLIEGWLVSSATMVAGSPESGKSSLVASMAAAVASEGTWLGEPVTTDRTGPVMILTSDPAGSGEWAQKGRDLDVEAGGWEIYRFSPEHWDDYVELAGARSCRLLVFDNITSGVSRPINGADPSSVLGPLERVTDGGTPVAVIAHRQGRQQRPDGTDRLQGMATTRDQRLGQR